jgi:DtxR family Mn-dependent transcriptional regulator
VGWGGTLDYYFKAGNHRGDGADRGQDRGEHDADCGHGQRNFHESVSAFVFDDDAADVAFADQLADLVHEFIGVNPDLFVELPEFIHVGSVARNGCATYGACATMIDRRGRPGVRITISKENYLKAIVEAESDGQIVKAVTLARWLHVSAPAVTMAIKRLRRDALIRVGAEGNITLTTAGREIANRLLNRHQLIERMLSEIFGLEWYKVHDEAEQLEHAVSADFERKLIEKLGTGAACPHGNMVETDSPRDRRKRGLKPLEEARVKERVAIVSVFERDRKLLEYLDRAGIRPGVRLEVISADGELALAAGPHEVRIDRAAAGKVWVKAV